MSSSLFLCSTSSAATRRAQQPQHQSHLVSQISFLIVSIMTMRVVPTQVARKRRMEILASQKKVNKRHRIVVESEDDNDTDDMNEEIRDDSSISVSTPPPTKKSKSNCHSRSRKKKASPSTCTSTGRVIKSNTKYQNRYEPEVPMTKEQEAEWRKEARKQRNRESAAASRNKVRNRIIELESEVEGWKAKYMALMQRLDALEKATPFSSNSISTASTVPASPQQTPKTIYVPSNSSNVSLCTSGNQGHNVFAMPTIPSLTLTDSSMSNDDSTLPSSRASQSQQTYSQHQHQHPQPIFDQNVTNQVADLHVIEMKSRPAES